MEQATQTTLIFYEDSARRSDLTYTEKKVKDKVDRVTVELNGNESGVFTKLASRYDRLGKALAVMKEKRDQLNADIKLKAEQLFDAEDIVLTRVVETVSFTMTISKRSKVAPKTTINYEKIAEELAKLIPDELQSKVDEIVKAYTTITEQPDKSPALTVKGKVTEGLLQSIIMMIGDLLSSIKSWGKSYDAKLNRLKAMAK